MVTTINGYKCSECSEFNAAKDNYCPNCGAKMIEPQESEEVKRILKYYGDCPCWNLCSNTKRLTWKGVVPVLEVHVNFRDLKQSFIQERKDIMNAKRRKKK